MNKKSPAVRWWAVLLSFGLLALSGIALRDLWVHFESNGISWLAKIFELIGTQTFEMRMVWSGVAAIAVGFIFLFVACKPAPTTHVGVAPGLIDDNLLWIRPVDIARHCSATIRQLPGISTVQTQVTRSRRKGLNLFVSATGDTEDPELFQRVNSAVEPIAKILVPETTITVDIQPEPEVGESA
ncbi:MAG: hypothetical protein SOW59_02175 [Corynebacterium sp.]|nr:hypothetical protein [Corynebacterium sp.]